MIKPHDRVSARLVLIYGFAVVAGYFGIDRLHVAFDGARQGLLFSLEILVLALTALVGLFVLVRSNIRQSSERSERLRADEHHLEAVLGAQEHGIGSVGPDGIVRHSNGFVAMGVASHDLRGRHLRDCLSPDFRAIAEPMIARALNGERVSFTVEVEVEGQLRLHQVVYTPVQTLDGKPDGFAYAITDLTDSMRAKAHVQRAYTQLQDAIESLSDAFTLYDADRRIVACNQAFRDLFPIGGKALRVGSDFDNVVDLGIRNGHYPPGVDATAWRRMRRDSFDTADGQPRDHMLRSGRTRRVLESRTRDGGVVGIYADISEIRRAESKARESEARLQAILDNAPFGIFLKDAEGRFVVVNAEMKRIGAPSERAMVGMTSYDVLDPTAAAVAADRDQRVLKTRSVETAEIEVRSGDQPRKLTVTKFPVVDREGAMLGIGCVAADVTQRRHLEAQLLQLQKMEAIGQLTGGVAHDFNNLLSVVLGNLSLLRRRLGPAGAEHDRLIDAAILASRRGASLTRQLLAFSRRQMLAPEAFLPGQAATDMQDLLRQSLGEQIDFDMRVAADHWPVFLDRAQFENALLNLVINARDAMADKGVLSLAVDNLTVGGFGLAAADEPCGDYVRVQLRDSGHGMTPEVAARIFEPFFTTKGGDKGTGLGLSMVYGFVRQSNGHIAVESAPGAGTTVTLLFPRHSGPLGEQRQADPPVDSIAPKGGRPVYRILVVEDESLLRGTAVELLRGMGHAVEAAEDGPHALDELARSGPFDLLFTDLVMPGGMTGIELAREARRRHPGLRVLATSGYASVHVLRGEARELPPLLAKPYSEYSLASHIAQVFAEEPA